MRRDPAGPWTERYFELRGQIEELEMDLFTRPGFWRRSEDGLVYRQLSSGATVWLGSSDANYPPGTPERGRLNLNSSMTWLRLVYPPEPGQYGWWAPVGRSMHRIQGQIDKNGYTLPAEIWATYWRCRVTQLEGRLRMLGEDYS